MSRVVLGSVEGEGEVEVQYDPTVTAPHTLSGRCGGYSIGGVLVLKGNMRGDTVQWWGGLSGYRMRGNNQFLGCRVMGIRVVCTLSSVYTTVCTLQCVVCTLNNVYTTVCNMYFSLYCNMVCVVWSMQCEVFSVKCVVCSV